MRYLVVFVGMALSFVTLLGSQVIRHNVIDSFFRDNGKGSGYRAVHRVTSVPPATVLKGVEVDSLYFDDGSIVKEMPHGTIMYDAKSDKFFFRFREGGKLAAVTKFRNHEVLLQRGQQMYKCQAGREELLCPEYSQSFDMRYGRVEQKIVAMSYRDLEGFPWPVIRSAMASLFGEGFLETSHYPYRGVVTLNDRIVLKFETQKIERFTSYLSVSNYLKGASVVGECTFYPDYYCE